MSSERASIKIYSEAKNNLTILAKRNGKSEIDYLSMAIQFLYKSGIDVYTTSLPNIPDLIKNLENRIIGFIKKREQDFFVPMKGQVQGLTESHIKLFDALQSMDILKFATENAEKDDVKFTVPANQIQEEKQPKKIVEHTIEKETFSNDENLLGELEKAKAQRKIFRTELSFLFSKLSKSGALSGGKFNANINQRDYERIQKILNDN